MKFLETRIALPPGFLATDIVRQIVATATKDFGWVKLERYGRSEPDTSIPPGHAFLDAVAELYEETQRLVVGGSSRSDDSLMFRPDRRGSSSYLGFIIWFVKPQRARDHAWREAHAIQVADVMRRVESPYAFAALDDDIQRKTRREAAGEHGTIRTYTVRSCADGLAGVFWRNFFGTPFVNLFRGRLDTLPPGTSRSLPGGIRLVEPYPGPEDALTEEGAVREAAVIAHLGKEAFYDHARHLQPARLPDLPALPMRE